MSPIPLFEVVVLQMPTDGDEHRLHGRAILANLACEAYREWRASRGVTDEQALASPECWSHIAETVAAVAYDALLTRLRALTDLARDWRWEVRQRKRQTVAERALMKAVEQHEEAVDHILRYAGRRRL